MHTDQECKRYGQLLADLCSRSMERDYRTLPIHLYVRNLWLYNTILRSQAYLKPVLQ